MDRIFFKELQLDIKQSINLNIGSGLHGEMTGKMLEKIELLLLRKRPEMVLVQGDTNTVVAGALAAVKLHIPVGHIEAGLRSYDRRMPEEHNRIVADHLADFLFAPTPNAKKILRAEGIAAASIYQTGNTIVDAVIKFAKLAKSKSKILSVLKLKPKKYLLLTLHRQENVDDQNKLSSIFSGLQAVSKKYNLPIIYPIHPRAAKKIQLFKLKLPANIRIIKPVGFFDFLRLEQSAKLIFTDSGGVQEESCILRVPCVTLRDNTERPETLTVGSNKLAGANSNRILKNTTAMLNNKTNWVNPFGQGNAGEKIISIIKTNANRA